MTHQQPTTHGPPRASLSDVGTFGAAGERSHALLGDLLGGGQSGRRLTPLRGIHFEQADLDARRRADRRPGRLGESPGLPARELTASRDDDRAALLPWLRQARPRSRSLSVPYTVARVECE